ncbi:hypothetical protein SE18_11000 [Herpetosiphon geysericola]|uniref:Glycosyltransferase RgtA/B/C/D-like domain-containing protein n=2 Tax=Herpetosiphon geysericola TaxID=70996 RepID=A0A0N8GRN8_9CHLR|nr:hypothetical protein SE18_11000 [Herpetosiphon geysericola]
MAGGSLWLVTPEDFWWQLKIGDLIRQTGTIPQNGIFSATQANTPFFYQSWLAEVVFSWLYQLGDLVANLQLRNLLLISSYGLLLWHCLRRVKGNSRAALLGILFSVIVAFDSWQVRPQMFAWLLFAATFVIISEVATERWSIKALSALPLIEILWVNLHSSFTLGPLLVGIAALGAMLDRRRDHPDAPIYPTMRALWIASGVMLATSLINPRGWGVWVEGWSMLTALFSPAVLSEQASPLTTLSNPVSQLMLAVLLVAVVTLLVIWQKMRSADLLIISVLALLTLTGAHYQIWFGMVAGPIIAEALVRRGRLKLIKRNPAAPKAVAVLAIACAVIGLLVQPIIRIWLPLPEALNGATGNLTHAELASGSTPIQAVEFLQANQPNQAYFNDMGYGSYLIWKAGEQLPVFIDPRVELYPREQWNEYSCIMAGKDWERLLAKYSLDTILIDRELGNDLVRAVQTNPAWQELYADQQSLIFKRTAQAAQASNQPVSCPATN